MLVNGVAVSTLRPLSAHRTIGGRSLDTATFEVDLGAAGQYVQNLALAEGGADVEIVGVVNGGLKSFAWGKASVNSIKIGDGESLGFTARIEPYHLGLLMTGAFFYNPTIGGPQVIQIDPVFNPLIDGAILPNKSPGAYLPGNTPVFVDPESVRTPQAQSLQGGAPQPWSLADAVQYLCWSLNPSQLNVQNPNPLDLAALPPVLLYNVGLRRGQFLSHYLDELLEPWGWTWKIELLAPGLRQIVVFARGFGTPQSMFLQAPGSAWAGDNAVETAVDYNVGTTTNNVTVAGDWHYFESTFVLQRAWPKSKDTTAVTDFSQDADAYQNDATNHRVWREWVLNEAGDYNGTRPEISAAFDFEAILGHPLIPRRQKFLPTLALDHDLSPLGSLQGISVDYSIDNGETWRPITRLVDSTCQILQREAGIRFDGDQVPIELYTAGDKAKVRVTATLRDDERLGLNIPNDFSSPLSSSNPTLVDTSDRHHWREILPSSKYFGTFSSAITQGNTADDSVPLALFAATLKAAWDMADVSGPIEIEGLDSVQYDLSDVITEINGRAVSFAAAASGRWPQVAAISYDFQSQKRTLHLETFRLPGNLPGSDHSQGGGHSSAGQGRGSAANPLGQLNGPGGETRPRQNSTQSSGIAVRRMKITSALAPGAAGEAKYVTYDSDDDDYVEKGDAIAVHSYSKASGAVDDELDFAYRPDSQRWEAIEGKGGANGWITFTTASALLATDANQADCPVVLVWEGKNPGNTVTVINELGFAADAGVDGYAKYSAADDKWKIIQIPCPAGDS